MLSHLREERRLRRNVYVLVDDRNHEPEFFAFSSWEKMCKKAAELIMDRLSYYNEELREELRELFRRDSYEQVLYAWREGYGWGNGVYLRTEILRIDGGHRYTETL